MGKLITIDEAVSSAVARRKGVTEAFHAEQMKIMNGLVSACDESIRKSMSTGHNNATAGYIWPSYADQAVEMLQKAFPGFRIWYGKSMALGSPMAQINVQWPDEEPPVDSVNHA